MAGVPERTKMPLVGEPMVEWAVWYARVLGWRVFPVKRSADPEQDKTAYRAWLQRCFDPIRQPSVRGGTKWKTSPTLG